MRFRIQNCASIFKDVTQDVCKIASQWKMYIEKKWIDTNLGFRNQEIEKVPLHFIVLLSVVCQPFCHKEPPKGGLRKMGAA